MIRCLTAAGLPVQVYAIEVDGVAYSPAEVERIVRAQQSNTTAITSVRPAHRVSGLSCEVSGCDEKRTGTSCYCKKHHMRYVRHGDASVALQPWGKHPKKKGPS